MRTASAPIMTAPGRHARRSLSQVHLSDERAIRAIAERFKPLPSDCVLEVGSGTGNLTDYVSPHVRRMVCVETDPAFADALARRTASRSVVEVVHGDILEFDAARHFAGEPRGSVRVLTNLPYHITSAFFEWLFERRALFADAFVMLQREVAQNFLRDTSDARGWLPHRARFCARVESVLRLPPSAFSPQPKVASEVVRFVFREPPACVCGEKRLFEVIGRSFTSRRKTLISNLRGWTGLTPAAVEAALAKSDLKKTARAEELTLAQFIRFADALEETRA